LELRDFLTCGDILAAELYTEFYYLKDFPGRTKETMKAGDMVIMTNWAIYNLDANDKMKRIRIAHAHMHDS
jgi:hypothetical protein